MTNLGIIIKLALLSLFLSSYVHKETYVLIHGAGAGAYTWYKIKSRLEDQGCNAIAFDLPSLGIDRADVKTTQLDDHVNTVLVILSVLPKPAIVVGYSYGGAVLSLVSEAMPHKVKKAVFLSAFMLQDGEAVMDAEKRNTKTLVNIHGLYENDNIREKPKNESNFSFKEAVCDDCSSEDLALMGLIRQYHPKDTLFTPIRIGAGFASVKKVYIVAAKDNALTAEFQRDMYSKFPDTQVYSIEASHLLAISRPDEVVGILKTLA